MSNYIKTLFYNPDINKKKFFYVALVLGTLFILIFHVSRTVLESSELAQGANGICVVGCGNNKLARQIVKSCKGSDYLLDSGSCQYEYDCFMSIWELTHVYLHIFIGYYLDMRYVMGIGISFEIYERLMYNCENWMDIGWNTMGGLIGATCRYIQKET
jgi:hypothetical protein